MNNLTLYGNSPFDLIDRLFSNEDLNYTSFRTPAVDISEEETRYLIEAELPGLSEKDVKLELKDGILYLSTAKKETTDEKSAKNRWLRRERREFQFSRSFDLPDHVDVEKIEASFRDGLLTVTLPKKPEAAPRLVPVRAA